MTRARALLVIGTASMAAALLVAGCSGSGSAQATKPGTPRSSGVLKPSPSTSATPSRSPSSAKPTPAPPPDTALRPGVSDKDLVQALVVPPEKLDSSWSMMITEGGDGLSVNTLDLCGAAYPSEALRTARRQVQYGPDADNMSISNEIVTYKPGGAAQALKEVQHAVATCPGGEVQEKDPHGGMAKYRVQKLLVTGSKWLPGTQSYYVEIDHDDGSTFTDCEIIQSRANVVDIVYGTMNGQEPSSETMTLANAVADALSVSAQNV